MKAHTLLSKALIMSTILIASCVHSNWSDQQRREALGMLRGWRDIAYLNDLTDEEFALFAASAADILEHRHPTYEEFVEMPMVEDSVEMVIIATITSDLTTSPERLRHIFRYDDLVALGILPAGLTLHEQNKFYRHLAKQLTTTYGSLEEFVREMVVDGRRSTVDGRRSTVNRRPSNV